MRLPNNKRGERLDQGCPINLFTDHARHLLSEIKNLTFVILKISTKTEINQTTGAIKFLLIRVC